VVDLEPLVGQLRDGATPSISAILSALVFMIGTVVMALALRDLAQAGRQRHDWRALAAVLGWTAGVLAFGIYWNASDDQFYFQLAIPMGVLIAAHRRDNTKRRTVWLTMTVAVLVWNLVDVTSRFVLYPRAERIRMLDSGLAGAGLVVYPGYDEIGQLEPFIRTVPPRRFLSIAGLADQHPPQEGLSLLRQRIEETLAAGASVDVVAIYDVPQRRQPWKALRELGYDYGTVLQLLSSFPVESSSRWMGPFSIRVIASMPRAAGKPR